MIVAFLQNMWGKNPAKVKAMLERTHPESERDELRLRLIKYSLFDGCLTGRRLRAAFGDVLCEAILWEESTREIAGDPKTIFPAQPEHIRAVLEKYQPGTVVTFGKIAANAVAPLWTGPIVHCPHPAARQSTVMDELKNAAKQLWWHR